MNENIKTESEQLEDEIQALDAPTTASDGDMMAPPEPLVNTEIKVKRGTGWKVATFIFAVIAILGVGAAAYLFFSDGTTNFLGRKVTSAPADKQPVKKQVVENNDDTNDTDDTDNKPVSTEISYKDGYLNIPQWGVKLNVNGTKSFSYKYKTGDDYETITFWGVDPVKGQGIQALPAFATPTVNKYGIGALHYSKTDISKEYGMFGLVYEIPNNGGFIYSEWSNAPFSINNGADDEQELEIASIQFLRNKVILKSNFSAL